MKALGDRKIGKEFGRKDVGRLLLRSGEMSDASRRQLYTQLSQDLLSFLENAVYGWQEGEECRRFSIFGDCITCSHWEGMSLVSAIDVVKVVSAMYRLEHSGLSPKDRRRFEEAIISDLRNLKVGRDALLEPANSPLLNFLYRINSVRTHKRQKVYRWEAVDFEKLYRDACDREDRASRPEVKGFISPGHHIGAFVKSAFSPTTGGVASPSSWGSPPDHRAHFSLVAPMPMPRAELVNSYKDDDETLNLALLAFASELRSE